LIGAATLWPPVYLVLFLSVIGLSFFSIQHPGHPPPTGVFAFIFPLHCLTMILSFALTAVYIVHAVRNDRLTQEMRIIWIIILFMGNLIAFPVYWWLYLRPGAENPPEAP